MILSFKTQINKKPTYFVEKIWEGFPNQEDLIEEWFMDGKIYEGYDFHPDATAMLPKLHTIRTDEKNRWKKGVLIDFFINARQKKMFRFAPRIPAKFIQHISILHDVGHVIMLIDDVFFGEIWHHGLDDIYEYSTDLESLSKNDGFESVEHFFNYFSEDFHGKIIHWTDLKY